jgi:hypothetical protein
MRAVRIAAPLLLVLYSGNGHAATEGAYVPRNSPERIQSVVDGFRERLEITQEVTVTVVAANEWLVSVESSKDRENAFVLCLEDSFVDRLDAEDLGAVVAHELGHVWIFTHHPYLQTERLANQIAVRLVSRESLRKAYAKVWERLGTKGDLARFLGE